MAVAAIQASAELIGRPLRALSFRIAAPAASLPDETINSKPRMIFTQYGANSGCHLKIKLATSVSTTDLAVELGGDVCTALLINKADEGFRFFRWPRINVAQQPIEAERASPEQVGRVFDGVWWHTIHVLYSNASVPRREWTLAPPAPITRSHPGAYSEADIVRTRCPS